MGCDIHPVLEKKWTHPKTGETKWVGQHAFPYVTIKEVWKDGAVVATNVWHSPRAQSRDYGLFAKLAGVRGDGPDPRGYPEDVSDLTLMELGAVGGNADLHSHSWASAREWVTACISLEEDLPELVLTDNEDPRVKDPYKHYLELDIETYEDDDGLPMDCPDNYRVVFAFDN
ncbi:hypothetical protein [Bradyrhizobium cenepequi]